VLPLKLVSPLYTAVTMSGPVLRLAMLILALFALTAAGEPSGVPLSLNCTVPVGVPAPGATAATVAVNVTDSPKAGLALLLATIVVVVAWPTAKATSADVLVTKLESPAY